MPDIASSVRITPHANGMVSDLAERLHTSKAQVIETALRALEEKLFWADVHDAYAAMADDPAALASYRDEIAEWDSTLSDGLYPEPETIR